MHSFLVTTNLVHCTLTTRRQQSIQLNSQPAMPRRTQQQIHSPTHHPTVISSTAVLFTLAHDDQVEPLPAHDILGDLLPFLRAGRLTLISTSPHDLLVENNLYDSTVLGEQQSQLTSYQRRKVGLSEKEREWPIGSQSSYYGDSPVQRNATGSPAPVTVTAQSSHQRRPMFSWCSFIALGPYSSSYLCSPRPSVSLTLDLIPLSPTSPSLTQAPSTALMIPMAKLIMHRHVRVAFFRFPFVNLAHISRFLITFFPDDALNPPSPLPLPYPRRHIAVSTSSHLLPSSSKHHPRSILICPRQMAGPSSSPSTQSTCIAPETRSATATPTPVTITSTIANAATTMIPPDVARPLS